MATNGTTNGTNGSERLVVPLQINGQEVKTAKTYDVKSPSTGKVIWKSSAATTKEAIAAVESAEAAFPSWSQTKPSARRDLFLRASDILASRADEYGQYMDDETGSANQFSTGFNVPTGVELLRDVAGRIVTSTGYIPVCGEEGKSALIYKEPYGVVFGIAPW